MEFISINERIDTTTYFGKLNITMLAAFNRMMSDRISEDTCKSLRNKKSKLQPYSKTPFGLQVEGREINSDGKVTKSGSLIPNPQEKEIVKKIFSYSASYANYTIAKLLKEQNLKTQQGKDFLPSTIKKIIKNKEVYLQAGIITDEERN